MTKGRSLFNIVEKEKGMPSYKTVFNWLNPNSDYHDEDFLHNYACASEIRSEKEFEEILDIADDQEDDIYLDKDGKECVNHNVINRSRLRVDARKWRLGKMQPKKYGDKLDLTSGNKPIKESKVVLNMDGKSIKLE